MTKANPAAGAGLSAAQTPLLSFVHVPKTGGTSLGVIFQNNDWPTFHIGHPDQARAFLAMTPQEQDKQYGVFGHMPFGIDKHVSRPVTYITFLRHPVERVLSAYSHNLRHPDGEGADIIRKRGIAWTAQPANFMCLFLANYDLLEQPSGEGRFWWDREPPAFIPRAYLDQAKAHLDQCAFIGLTETYDEDVRALARLKGHNIAVPAAVPREQTGSRLAQSELTEEQIEAIRAGNRLDLELYDYALALRDQWGGPLRPQDGEAPRQPRKSAPAPEPTPVQAMTASTQPLTWTKADLEWEALPDHKPAGALPWTFAIPAAECHYGAGTGLLRPAHTVLRIRARALSGVVGFMVTSADGSEQLSPDRVLTPAEGLCDVYFRISPQMAPAILVAQNHHAPSVSGSVEIVSAHYAPPGAWVEDSPGVARAPGLVGRILERIGLG